MAANMEDRKREYVNSEAPGWKMTDIMAPVTYYEDGVRTNDHGRNGIEVIMMTFLGFSPDMQQKPWTKMCIGYINNTLLDVSRTQVEEI
jgi:hypothetical protein